MSEVKSIFGNFDEIELNDDDQNLVESCKDFIKESKEFTDYLIIEDDRNKNNVRWYSSNELFVSGMTMLIIHQELIEGTIQDYKNKHGLTSIIKKFESMFRKLITHNEETIRPYKYLINFNECEKRIEGYDVQMNIHDKTLTDYRKENYLVSSYVFAIRRRWCMSDSCGTCGATDLRKLLFESAIGNEISDDEKKEIIQTTRYYPRTSNLPETIKEKVIESHINEFNKIEIRDIENIDRLIEENSRARIYRRTFKEFIRFIVMDIWNTLEYSLSHADRLNQLKSKITSKEVLDVLDEMNNHFQSLRKRHLN